MCFYFPNGSSFQNSICCISNGIKCRAAALKHLSNFTSGLFIFSGSLWLLSLLDLFVNRILLNQWLGKVNSVVPYSTVFFFFFFFLFAFVFVSFSHAQKHWRVMLILCRSSVCSSVFSCQQDISKCVPARLACWLEKTSRSYDSLLNKFRKENITGVMVLWRDELIFGRIVFS